MKIRCVGQRIVVKLLSPEERRGLLMPKDVIKKSTVAEVIDKGPDATWVEVGDIVHFGRYAGTIVTIDDLHIGSEYEGCLYMNCEDVLGVLEGAKAGEQAAQPQEVANHG